MKLVVVTQVVDKNHSILGFFHRWLEEFSKHFERIDVICLQVGEHSLPAHVHVHSLGKERGVSKIGYVWNFYRLFNQALKQKPAFVFFHMGAIFNILAAPYYLFMPSRPKFFWWKTHGQINLAGRIALLFVDKVFTAIARSFPVVTKKRTVVGHAIDVENFSTAIETAKDIDLLYVGRLSRAKRIDLVVDVVERLSKSHPDLRCVLVGSVVDQDYFNHIKSRIAESGLQKHIVYEGECPYAQIVDFYARSKIVINPSEHHGLDKVILEAMAAGALPLTSNHSFAEMLSPFDLYVTSNNATSFCEKISPIINNFQSSENKDKLKQLRRIVILRHSLSTLPHRLFNFSQS